MSPSSPNGAALVSGRSSGRRFIILAAALGIGLPAAVLPGQEPVNTVPIELPEYEVVGERLPPQAEEWWHARIEGYEVLSSAGEAETRRLAGELQRFAHALDLVWPGLRPAGAAPALLLVCGREGEFTGFQPAARRAGERASVTFTARSFERVALFLDEKARVLNLADLEGDASVAEAANAAAEAEAEAGGENAGAVAAGGPRNAGVAVDPYQQLYREHVRLLLGGVRPPLAPWLAEGLAQLFMNLRITATEISVGRVENPNETTDPAGGGARPDRDFNAALARRALLPLAEMFAVAAGSDTAEQPVNSTWAKQCYAFVHWGLYGDFGRHQREFLRFIARAQAGPPGEALFRSCFGLDYAGGLQALRTHIEMTRTRVAGVRAAPGEKIPFPPAPTVREASLAEIGRLKAEAFALGGHAAEAREALITAYRLGAREPALLAALGLAELEAGDAARARKFLEAGAAAAAERPRTAVALARVRLAAAREKPGGEGGRPDAAQLAQVLAPVRAVLARGARLAPVYETLAEALVAGGVLPEAAEAAWLAEGRRLFPQHARLAQLAAALGVAADPARN